MKKATPWIIVFLLAAGFTAWYLYRSEPPAEHPSVIEEQPQVGPEPLPEPEYPVTELEPELEFELPPLPDLDQSDQQVGESLAEFLGAESLGLVLVFEQIINRVVATVDSLDSRELAPLVLPVHAPDGAFLVEGSETYTASSDNADRYEPYMHLVRELDIDRATYFYRRHYPLFQESYQLLGYQDAYFNDRLVQVIEHLLATPTPGEAARLLRVEAVYVYEDPALESLTAGQKVLLRIGPEHGAIVREKLRAFHERITRSHTLGPDG